MQSEDEWAGVSVVFTAAHMPMQPHAQQMRVYACTQPELNTRSRSLQGAHVFPGTVFQISERAEESITVTVRLRRMSSEAINKTKEVL